MSIAQNQNGEQSVVDLSTLTISDLEDNDSDLDELFLKMTWQKF